MTKLEQSYEAARVATDAYRCRVYAELELMRSVRMRKTWPTYRSLGEGGKPSGGLHFHRWGYVTGYRVCLRCGCVQARGFEDGDPMGNESWTTWGYVDPATETFKEAA